MSWVVRFLRWRDVDPAQREFDPSLARAVALEVIGDVVGADLQRNLRGGVKRSQIETQLETALLRAYGPWIAGWNWAASEPGNGGPIRSWCCDDHSIYARGDRGALPTIDRVVAAASEWRSFLEELVVLFGKLRTATAGFDLPHRTEHAASQLVALVVERTGAEDAWHYTFTQILTWFLESCGDDVSRVILYEVVRGKFSSWCAPSLEAIATTARELGDTVRRAIPVVDSLPAWLALRETAFGAPRPEFVRRPVRGDAHRAFIDIHDRARDPERARRMETALEACRVSARAGEALTFERLAGWQQIVMGEHAPSKWRTTDAFRGHARYAYSPDLPARFDAALAQANGDGDVAVRAARAYLDVCFFHPFADGNARSARLVLDHVLTRAGLGLHAIEPLVLIARAADDLSGAYSFAYMIDQLAGSLP